MPDRTSSNPSNSQSSARREAILAYLRARGGRIESPSGVGLTAAISDAVGYGDVGVLNGMLARLEQEGLIERDIRGRRTFAISLTSAAGQAGRAASGGTAAAASSGGGSGRGGRSSGRGRGPARATTRKAARKAAPRRAAKQAAPRASASAAPSGDGSFVNAAGALIEQLSTLRSTIDELSQRVSDLESRGTAAPATATARKATGRKATAKRATAKKSAGARKAAKRSAKKATAKKATARKATAKRAPAKRATAKAAAGPRKAASARGTAKRGGVKKAAKRAPGRKAAGTVDERAAIRDWARSQGLTVNDRGRVPRDVVAAYRSAH